MAIRHLEDLYDLIKGKGKKVSVALGEDAHTLEALARGVSEELFTVVIFARKGVLEEEANKHNLDVSMFQIVWVKDETEAIEKAVKEVKEGRANVLMKGSCSSANYLRGILNKEWGLLPEGKLLSHALLMDIPRYHKFLIVSDGGVILKPTLQDKAQMINYCADLARSIGIETPKVAIITAVETVNPKMPATIDAAVLTQMYRRRQIKNCIVDGPLAMDLAVSKEAAEIKHVDSPVAGDADIIILPDIETGNAVVKAFKDLCNTTSGGILVGTDAPCVLTSRGDSIDTKFFSIIFAITVSK
jgi:phosphate butyryltransferase